MREQIATIGLRPPGGSIHRLLAMSLLGALMVACAPQQIVVLSIAPAPVDLYVDGRLSTRGDPQTLSLRSDRGHVLIVRRAGYRPQQIVIESVERAGVRRLQPDRIEIRLEPERSAGRNLAVELEPAEDRADEPERPPGAAEASEIAPGEAEK